MLDNKALLALGAFLSALPHLARAQGAKPPFYFCTKPKCADDTCSASITTSGEGYPTCKAYDTSIVLDTSEYEGSKGGLTQAAPPFSAPPPALIS
ncbi:MAG: hypothetical protein Q9217_003757 [Psora testacea]